MYQASVVIPTHNRPDYLREALQSVVSQEGVELDIIVVGDGTGEDSAAVAGEFPGVRYIRQPQAGPNAARNRAVGLAHHDCIALLDDDDLWLPGKLRGQLEILARHPDAAYVFSDFHILCTGRPLVSNGLSTWGIPETEWERLLVDPIGFDADGGSRRTGGVEAAGYRVSLYHAMLEHPYVLPTTAVFRKSFLTSEIRFVESDYICGDWEFFARLSRRHPAIYLPVETACNRSHEEPGRLTRTPGAVQLRRRLEMIARVWAADSQFMAEAPNRERVRQTCLHYLLALAKHQLRDGDGRAVLETLDQARGLGDDLPFTLRLARACAAAPAGLACLRIADRLVMRARAWLAR